jgi:L-methionine (R)-S-oxide reductase
VIDRGARYERIREQLESLIVGRSPTLVAAMATVCAVLHAKMPHHSWTGFYFVAGEDELHVGPYQGPAACQVLTGRGVCLHAVRTRAAVVVPDVSAFPGHVVCDPRSKSEIVIPVINSGRVFAVLDIDSAELSQFGPDDVVPLERIVALLNPFC